jgi:hypothetical protein
MVYFHLSNPKSAYIAFLSLAYRDSGLRANGVDPDEVRRHCHAQGLCSDPHPQVSLKNLKFCVRSMRLAEDEDPPFTPLFAAVGTTPCVDGFVSLGCIGVSDQFEDLTLGRCKGVCFYRAEDDRVAFRTLVATITVHSHCPVYGGDDGRRCLDTVEYGPVSEPCYDLPLGMSMCPKVIPRLIETFGCTEIVNSHKRFAQNKK